MLNENKTEVHPTTCIWLELQDILLFNANSNGGIMELFILCTKIWLIQSDCFATITELDEQN